MYCGLRVTYAAGLWFAGFQILFVATRFDSITNVQNRRSISGTTAPPARESKYTIYVIYATAAAASHSISFLCNCTNHPPHFCLSNLICPQPPSRFSLNYSTYAFWDARKLLWHETIFRQRVATWGPALKRNLWVPHKLRVLFVYPLSLYLSETHFWER